MYEEPLVSPETIEECVVAPVVEKVLVIEEYAVLAVVEYLQVAFSLVERDIVVCVVPDEREPLGEPDDLVGGVVSPALCVVALTEVDWLELLLAAS